MREMSEVILKNGETFLSSYLSGRRDFSHEELHTCDFGQRDFSRAQFSHANLTGSDLRGTNMYRAEFFKADLSNADLREAYFIDTDIRDALLFGIKPNFNDHCLVSELLRRAAGTSIDKLKVAGLVFMTHYYCWGNYIAMNDPLAKWALAALRAHETEDNEMPINKKPLRV